MMFKFCRVLLGGLLLMLLSEACSSAQPVTQAGRPANRTRTPAQGTPRLEAMDTVRWIVAAPTAPPIGMPDARPTPRPIDPPGTRYRMSLLLPFLSDEFDPAQPAVPDRSSMALQFYAGAQLAMEALSAEGGPNLDVEVIDSKLSDADFETLLASGRLDKAQVVLGPVRSNHIMIMAERAKRNRQILVSPSSPVSELVSDFPGFIQMNPSLRAHCTAITRHVRRSHLPENVVLVCKEKEANRLPYFRAANSALGGSPMRELILPDATTNFEQVNLAGYLRPGQSTAFILPTWSSQDFVMAFFTKLRAVMGTKSVEVYGMPQWKDFENIEPEYLRTLNVHISSSDYIDHQQPAVMAFEQQFLSRFGTVPDEDAFRGYNSMLFTGKMLQRYGLSFPEYLRQTTFTGLGETLSFDPVQIQNAPDDRMQRYDYLENTAVSILKFVDYRFIKAD